MEGTARADFRYIAKFRYDSENSTASNFRCNCENFAMIVKFSVLLLPVADSHFFNPGFKICNKLQKLIQEKLRKIAEK